MRNRLWVLSLTTIMAASAAAQTDTNDSTIVSVGYSKGDVNAIAGAVDQVTEERMNKGLITSSVDALSGQAAGVQVTPGGNQEAMISAVRVRGTTSLNGGNDPLVIIDGVTADLAVLSTIYPADIESFTILKDASETAQYGSRGAAGVIEVATKRGKEQQFHISYDGNIGFESVFKRVEMLNADEFREAATQFGFDIIDKGYNTDFNKAIECTGFVQNHHIAFGGGTEKANYRASVGFQRHKTVIKTQDYRNIIAKLDITQMAFDDHLTVDLGMVGSVQKRDYLPFPQRLFYSAATFNPTFPDFPEADGKYGQVTEALWISNPLSLLEMKEDEDGGHFNIHMKAKVNITKELTLRAFGSYSYKTDDDSHYYPTTVWSKGLAYRAHEKSEELRGNLSLTYAIEKKNIELSVMALAEAELERKTGFYTTVTNFSTDAFGYNKLSAGATRPWDGTDSYYREAHMESFLGRAQVTLWGRYTLTANARGDASSKFGKNHRWGFFPSISGAWVISKERWMKPLKWISNAKLRIGYGLAGSQGGIDSYNSMQLLTPNGVVPYAGSITTTLGIIRNANPDLKWEVKKTFNVGLDLSMWQKRIALSIDYYQSKTTDMLYVYTVPVPPFPYDKFLANLGSMQNSGLEIGFGITPLRTKDVELTINMNWSFERNELVTLNGDYNGQYLTAPAVKGISSIYGAGYHGGSDVCYQIVGQPLGVFLLPHFTGFSTAADGTRRYEVTKERYICGQATPKATMGSNIAFSYKNWDISIQMNGAFGHKIFNGTALTYMNMGSLPNYNVMADAPDMKIKDYTISDYWLENGDYLNIDYITVGWDVPIHSKYIQHLRLSCSVNNVATITNYSGLTPMVPPSALMTRFPTPSTVLIHWASIFNFDTRL